MRLVQAAIPSGRREAVIETLEAEGIDYVMMEETSGRWGDGVVSFPLPAPAVEGVLEQLRDVGIDESAYTVILEAETVISEQFEAFQAEYEGQPDASEDRIAREELASRARGLVSGLPTYVTLTVVSAVIATAGLLLDSPATVVGSMVIAPLIGPAMAASVGTVLDDRELFHRGIRLQILGIVLAVASAAVFAAVVQGLNLIPPGTDPLLLDEIAERALPNVLILAIAIGAGIAGILSLMTGVDEALVGVMIAVALLPPAAAVGIGIAFLIPQLALGASVFVLVNLFSINLAALVVLWAGGYRPRSWFRREQARSIFLKRVAVFLVAIAVLSVFLGGVTFDSYVGATTESEIRGTVVEGLEDEPGNLELLELSVDRSGTLPPLQTDAVVATVAVETTEPPEGLADRLAERIETVVDRPVDVQVRFVAVDRAGG